MLLNNEALIGNFVWGGRKRQGNMVNLPPSRMDGCVPRIIDDETWRLMQRRINAERAKKRSDEQLTANLRAALGRNPNLSSSDLVAQGLHVPKTYRKRLGGWSEAIQRAGGNASDIKRAVMERRDLHRFHARTLGVALARALTEEGVYATFDGHFHVLTLDRLHIWLRLLWSAPDEDSRSKWHIRRFAHSMNVDLELLIRMEQVFRPLDFFVATSADVTSRFPRWLAELVPLELARFWCPSPVELVERLRTLRDRAAAMDTAHA
jgi:hypothetical protein